MADLSDRPLRAVWPPQDAIGDACALRIAKLVTPDAMGALDAAVQLARDTGEGDLADALADWRRRLSELTAQAARAGEECRSELWLG